ncbi:diacylglycerol/lipid kinase family protein [Micromonospora rhizosphaerae]|uniref:diacylglycerol/lipid kinase family protein n=1 Tax=Micromonospora rhizosphaerae TaxID=568872 RepID=UPI001FE1D804|nr:diacylglycerol kinase family protein [Micromonospora rhizosphaerae]
MAILPAGTANLFAANLGIPEDLPEAVRIGLHGLRRTLDFGKLNGEHFAVMAGAASTAT